MEYQESYNPFDGDDKNDRNYHNRKILKARYRYEPRKDEGLKELLGEPEVMIPMKCK